MTTETRSNSIDDEAYYKPDLAGRHVVVVTADDMNRMRDAMFEFAQDEPRCTVHFTDGYARVMSVGDFCKQENPPHSAIWLVQVEVNGERNGAASERSAKFTISNAGEDNIEIVILGPRGHVDSLRRALEDRISAMTPNYQWFARRDKTATLTVLVVAGLIFSSTGAYRIAVVIFVFALLVAFGRRYVPRTAFSIGQGVARLDYATVVRQVVLTGLVVDLVAAAIIAVVTGVG